MRLPCCLEFALACLLVMANLFCVSLSGVALGQEEIIEQPTEAPRLVAPQRRQGARDSGRMYRQSIAPQWFSGNTKFWYRNDLADGAKEFIVVDAEAGTRQPAFDHTAMAQAFGNGTTATHLPVSSIEFNSTDKSLVVTANGKRYGWDAAKAALVETIKAEASEEMPNGYRVGPRTGAETSLTFVNKLNEPAEIFWLSGDGTKMSYGQVAPGASRDQHTFGGHRWLITDDKQQSLGEVIANDTPTEIIIDGRKYEESTVPSRRRRQRSNTGSEQPTRRSPDGKWEAFVEDFNIVVRSTNDNQTTRLSTDGIQGQAYDPPVWSPDSQFLISFRVKSVEVQEVHRIRSSPENGGRALLESSRYTLPGDPMPTYELNLFTLAKMQQVKPEVDRFEHEWARPRLRFSPDGKRFHYEQTDRGHGRFRLIEVTTESASVRNIIDERPDTFVWTTHTENQTLSIVNWLTNGTEIIHATEKNGWRQLILIDAASGKEKAELTPRGIVVRGIDLIDEEQRRVWFSASGRPGQDPYLLHYAHVDIDSGKLTWLTESDGNHSLDFSPDRKYLIDSYSRVDAPPAHELRRSEDGQLICKLEEADISELKENGLTLPEVFAAKGRDGQTDIWGIICRPKNYDPKKKYPVIEDIYAGPQGSFVPKSFSPRTRHESLTSMGFIVVQIDGMGTANRSKAFHDVCWKNLKDGGFADRILWMKAAAEKYPELDLSRVGIYGTSAGGQNAAAAVLFHPDFYKVAVAACGCHDNRMDKASWNEQWMGYPVQEHYGNCSNIDNAYRLQGKLFLIVGEMDSNVPPESTLRLADALIRADKDFDLLVVPNAGHGMGGAYGRRRMENYFVQHLLPEDNN